MATTLEQLQAYAEAISEKSPAIRKWALGTVAYLREQAQPIPAPPQPATPVPVGALMFSEDFTGPLDPTKWDVKVHGRWLPSNVSVHDGMLDIQATLDQAGVWHGGEIQSLAPAFQYVGPRYMECRAKVPAGVGTFAAPLWEWAAPWGGSHIENDVCEQLGREASVYHVTLHNNVDPDKYGLAIDTGIDLSADFHTYGCAMYDDRAVYYLDGRSTRAITKMAALAAGLTAWQFTTTPMCCVIDLDMGGSWAGPVNVSPPVHMLVEYVKIWALAL